jgi:3-ketosteroid 9alpha-monooxygenase subunit B
MQPRLIGGDALSLQGSGALRMTETATKPAASRLVTFDTIVREVVVETADTVTLVLEATSAFPAWRAGQYLSIDVHQFVSLRSFIGYLEQAKGRKEPPRAYSMSSAPHEPWLGITIKEELFEAGQTKYPPLISGYLVHQVRAGDRMTVRGFAGAYVLPEDVESRTEHVLHVCAGSGSVPDLSMVKHSLLHHARLRHTFIYSNKTWQDVIFRDALTALERQHPDRLRVIHALTRETGPLPEGIDIRRGRIGADLLRGVLEQEPESLVFCCGPAITVWERRACTAAGTTPPPRFLETMISLLDSLGVPRTRVTVESYG